MPARIRRTCSRLAAALNPLALPFTLHPVPL